MCWHLRFLGHVARVSDFIVVACTGAMFSLQHIQARKADLLALEARIEVAHTCT